MVLRIADVALHVSKEKVGNTSTDGTPQYYSGFTPRRSLILLGNYKKKHKLKLGTENGTSQQERS
jgi:hypothetical protein